MKEKALLKAQFLVCIYLDNKFDWFGIWFGISYICGGVWSNGLGQNRGTDREHDEDCVEEVFHLTRVKFDRDGKGSTGALCTRNSSINT